MTIVNYRDETNRWHLQLRLWVEPIMSLISSLGQGVPKASARVIDRQERIEFELTVEWVDQLLNELMVETFTYQFDKPK